MPPRPPKAPAPGSRHAFLRRWGCSAGLAWLLLLPLFAGTGHAETLYLATATEAPLSNAENTGFLDLFAKSVFQRVGYQVQIRHLPPERALHNANDGLDDGDLYRIGGLSAAYPNLIQVPEPTLDTEFLAFAKSGTHLKAGWKGLEGHSVGYVRGWKIVENKLRGLSVLTEVEDADALWRMLELGRADAVVFDNWQAIHKIQALGMEDIHPLRPPLSVNKMYVYLNKRHKDLVPRVAMAIREAKGDGTFDRLYKRILVPLLVKK